MARGTVTARARQYLWPAAVALLVLVTTFLIARWGTRVRTFNADELIVIFEGRHLQDAFPGALLGRTSRGLERLPGWLFGFAGAVTPSSASAFWLARVLWALSFAAAAPVAYAWARMLALPRTLSFAAAALAVCCPWMVFGTSFLDVVPAWSLATLALFAMWHALVRPSMRSDVLAILAVLATALARVGLGVVGVALPLGAIMMAIREARSVRGAARVLWRDHRLLVVLAAAGAALVAIVGTRPFVGGYPLRHPGLGGPFWTQVRIGWEQVADGAALIPAIVASAWALRSLVAPRDRAAEAFALVLVIAFGVLSYAALTQAPEERYLAGLAPMVGVGFAAALWRREAPPLLVAAVGLLMARVFTLGAPTITDPYGYQRFPAATWMHRVIVGRAQLELSFIGHHGATVVGLALAVAAVAIVAIRRSNLLLTGVAMACAAFGLAGGSWALKKFVDAAGRPDITIAQATFIDRAARNASVGMVDFEPEPVAGGQFYAVWRDVQIFNPQVATRVDFGTNAALGCCGALRRITLRVDPQTGRISSDKRLPDLLATINVLSPYGLALRQITVSDYLPSLVSLGRLTSRFVSYAVVAGDPGGHLSRTPIMVRVYRPQRTSCAFFAMDPPDSLVVNVAGRRAKLVDNGVALGRFAGRRWVDLELTGAPPSRLTALVPRPCP
jgi:hypothetical protein